jgi:hypothetical protein
MGGCLATMTAFISGCINLIIQAECSVHAVNALFFSAQPSACTPCAELLW